MSAETISAVSLPRPCAPPRRGLLVRPVAGMLADGTAFYAPIGEIVTDGALVICHLCGRSLRSVTAHLRVHGWTKEAYCEAFGLERGQSLEGHETRKRRATAFTSRLIFDPAVRAGSAAGRDRARGGELARDAAAAARGRRMPEQRRRKALRALAAIPPTAIAQANRERGRRHLTQVAAGVAQRHGYPDIGTFVLARVAQGASLTAISRQAGLHKDWLSRHLGDIDAAAAEAARQRQPTRWDAPWRPALDQLGFRDVHGYLHNRHLDRHWTVNAIAAEAGLSHHAVESALRRHGLTRVTHATKRHTAGQRAAQVAQHLGFDSITDYISDRRAAGWTLRAISAESRQPQSWLRRHQAQPSSPRWVQPVYRDNVGCHPS
jgi:AraC-like DNA-binding protein